MRSAAPCRAIMMVMHAALLADHPGDGLIERFLEAGPVAAVFCVVLVAVVTVGLRLPKALQDDDPDDPPG
jgi:hypothetical protein